MEAYHKHGLGELSDATALLRSRGLDVEDPDDLTDVKNAQRLAALGPKRKARCHPKTSFSMQPAIRLRHTRARAVPCSPGLHSLESASLE